MDGFKTHVQNIFKIFAFFPLYFEATRILYSLWISTNVIFDLETISK